MPSLKLLLLLLGTSLALSAQVSAPHTWSTEVDLLAIGSGGWYASLATGKGDWRERVAVAEVHPPNQFAPQGWEDGRVRAVALLVDHFFRPGFTGPWLGGGVEGWDQQYKSQGQREVLHLRSLQATFGGGWVFDLGRGFTVNPWGAVHQRIAGNREAATATAVCHPKTLTAEVSIKVGYAW